MSDQFREEMKEVLAEKKAQIMGDPEPVEEPVEEIVEEPVEAEPVEPAEELPEGFLTYDEYIEKGFDPDMYRGPKAFAEDKDYIGQIKGLRSDLSEQKETLFQINKFHEEQREAEQQKLQMQIQALEQRQSQAENDLDFDTYKQAQDRIDSLKEKVAPEAPAGEHPVFANARQADPRLNFAHPDFDPDFNALVQTRVNDSIRIAYERTGKPLTDSELADHLLKAKSVVEDKFKPAPPKRPVDTGAPKAAPKAKAPDVPKQIQDQIKKWENSNDPVKRESAEKWKIKYGIK